jgi:hypothetical protein
MYSAVYFLLRTQLATPTPTKPIPSNESVTGSGTTTITASGEAEAGMESTVITAAITKDDFNSLFIELSFLTTTPGCAVAITTVVAIGGTPTCPFWSNFETRCPALESMARCR